MDILPQHRPNTTKQAICVATSAQRPGPIPLSLAHMFMTGNKMKMGIADIMPAIKTFVVPNRLFIRAKKKT
jgi:hypothetical protein